jgi:transposase
MLSFLGSTKVYLATAATALRKSFNGLHATTTQVLQEDPRSGSLFVFCNRRRNRIKTLYWDGTGLWVMTKRLEKGTFSWPRGVDVQNGKLRLSPEALGLLIEGVDLKGGQMRPWYQRA